MDSNLLSFPELPKPEEAEIPVLQAAKDSPEHTPDINAPEEETVTENSILQEILSVDENGDSKASVVFLLEEYQNFFKDPNRMEEKVIRNIPINHVKVGICVVSEDYVQIDLCFKSSQDMDLHGVTNGLGIYADKLSNASDELEKGNENPPFPICSFAFSPYKYDGDFLLMASNPIFWALNAEFDQKPTGLRLLFKSDDVQFMESGITEDEKREIMAEVQREQTEQAQWQTELK